MKYVITMCNGEWDKPITLNEWVEANQDDPDLISDAYHEWLYGRPFICGGGAAPQFTNYLIDLPV